VTPWLRDGGIERVIQTTVPWLVSRGYRCEVASWNVSTHLSGQPNPVLATLSDAGVRIHVLHSYGRFRLLQRAAQAAALALRGGFRLLVSYELEGNLVALVARRLLLGRVHVIAQTHNASRIHAEVGTSPALLRLSRRLYREAAVMLAPSDSVREDSIEFFKLEASRVATLHNPLPVPLIRRRAAEDVDPAFDVSQPFIVGCGRLVRMKGFPDLIQAFAAIRRDRKCRLVILGEGPERESLHEYARQQNVADDVLMPGFVVNPWSYFARSRVFVLSSLFGEAFPMVLLEAMACGVPVVASRCEWGPEEILERGECGLLYDPGDIRMLEQHIRGLLDAPAVGERFVKAASRRAEEFSEDAVLTELERRIEARFA
jgi:glycosyltransferase involved in cell wall biosynthesis